jgi:ABC-type dipeptide/oligopeptide/nickel transport system permease subunit
VALTPTETPTRTPAVARPPAAPVVPGAALGPAQPRASRGLWRDAWRRLKRNKLAMAGLVFIILMVLVAVFANVLAPYDPNRLFPGTSYAKPSPEHLMGTDDVGRDVFSRLVYGARTSLSVAIFVQLLILVIGSLVGGVAGYYGGRVDNLLMRFTDVFFAFPDLLFVIVITAALGSSLFNIFLAIGLVNWTTLARIVRGQLLSLRERDFVVAARSVGVGGPRMIAAHLLPNAAGPMIVQLTYGIPYAILTEAVLSFIGLGVKPPNASWGTMIERGSQAIFSAPHMVLFPGLAIALTMLAFNFLGDGLRDALDPRINQ